MELEVLGAGVVDIDDFVAALLRKASGNLSHAAAKPCISTECAVQVPECIAAAISFQQHDASRDVLRSTV